MDFLQANLIPILVVAAIAIFIIARLKSKKDKEKRTKVHQELEADALSKGLQVTGQAQGSVMGSEVMGDTDYKGTTGGINWTLKSSIQRGRNTRGGNILRKSMWRTNAVNLPQGKFIMVVSTPGEMKAGPIQRGGFMNTLINKAADAMLDFYVGAYFGNENKALVNIGEDGVKLEREALKDFLILTNHETLANRFLDESTSSAIAGWKKSSQGFSRESLVDNFGLLFGPDGVILTCMANMTNAEEVKLFSDFGAVLVAKMKAVVA